MTQLEMFVFIGIQLNPLEKNKEMADKLNMRSTFQDCRGKKQQCKIMCFKSWSIEKMDEKDRVLKETSRGISSS